MLGIPLNLSPDVGYKNNRFSEALLKKSLEFVSNKRDNTVIFILRFVLFPVEVDLIPVEKSCKRYVLRACSSGYVIMVLALPTKVVVLYMRVILI